MCPTHHAVHLGSRTQGTSGAPRFHKAAYTLQALQAAHCGCSFCSPPLPTGFSQRSLLTTTALFRSSSAQAQAIAMSQNLLVLGGPAHCWLLGSSRKKALIPAFCHPRKRTQDPQTAVFVLRIPHNPLESPQYFLPLMLTLRGFPQSKVGVCHFSSPSTFRCLLSPPGHSF